MGQNKIVVKLSLLSYTLLVLLVVICAIIIYVNVDAIGIRHYVLVGAATTLSCVVVLVVSNTRVELKDGGIHRRYSIGVGPFKIGEEKGQFLRWKDVDAVYQVSRFPFRTIVITGIDGLRKRRMSFSLSSAYSNSKQALTFLREKLPPEVFEDPIKI